MCQKCINENLARHMRIRAILSKMDDDERAEMIRQMSDIIEERKRKEGA
jgi:hypothetical protein